jgi:hypothetical protein
VFSSFLSRMRGVKSLAEVVVLYTELPLPRSLCGIAFWEAKRGL